VCLSKFGDTLGGRNRVNLEMYSEIMSEQVWICTWRLCSSKFGDTLGGYDRVRLDQYLEAVDGRRTGC